MCHETILVVESNCASRQHLLTLLESQGYRVDIARNGKSAFAALQASKPDITILGAILSDMSAFDLYRRLNADGSKTPFPVLFILEPGTISGQTLDFLAHYGAEFITLPFDDNELLFRVRISLMARRRDRRFKQELKMLRESEQNFRSFARHSLDSFMRFDRQYRHLYVNPIVERQTGIPPEEFIGKTHAELGFPCPLVAQWEQAIETTFLSQQPFRIEFELPSKIWIDWLLIPEFSDNGEVNTVITLARDITEFKRFESALQEAKNAAEAASRAKTEFLARMSHEIRTPMNAVIGLSHLALQTDIAEKQNDYLNKIHSSAYSLLGIINDILDFSKIEAGKLEIETIPFELQEVLKNVSTVVSLKATEKGLPLFFSVDPHIPPILLGDPLRLGQILINLVNNAVKFTESGMIKVAVTLVELCADKAQLTFSVQDSGVGIDKAQIPMLFQPFSQADTSMTREYGGSGLGLTICKRLAGMMGGDIQVDSALGKGSTFTLLLNLTYQQGEAREMPHSFSYAFQDMHTLLVDDSPTSRKALSLMLKSFSLDLEVVNSGRAALETLEKAVRSGNPYRLILMDWKMPEMDGIQLAERIKHHPELPQKPIIIMVSSYGREEVIQRAKKAGADGFLIKPVTPSVLFETINEAFNLLVPPSNSKKQQEIFQKKRQAFSKYKARVLLVEDNLINQQVARELLESAGILVDSVNNGREALETLYVDSKRPQLYDAVLMDIQMPEVDGYAATREIRRREAATNGTHFRLPVIAMTAHAMQGEREKCLNAGMDDYVKKPIVPARLFAVLEKWLSSQGLAETAPEATIQTKAELSQSLPAFNTEDALQRVGGNVESYKRLLQKFATYHSEDMHCLREALRAGNVEHARQLAHTLKGMSGNLGMTELYTAAFELEKMILSEGNKIQTSAIAATETAFRQALQQIETLEPEDIVKAADGKSSEPRHLLEELTLLLQDDDMDAMECLNSLKKRLSSSPDYSNDLRTLERYIEGYDFQHALEALQQLSQRFYTNETA